MVLMCVVLVLQASVSVTKVPGENGRTYTRKKALENSKKDTYRV
jgi:hypothetical protein